MSFIKLVLQLAFWFAAATYVPKLLAPYVGKDNANYIYWAFLAFYLVGSYVLGKINSKQGHRNTKILPPSNDMPKKVREIATELETIGFRQVGILEHKALGSFKKQIVNVYINKSRNIFAYANRSDTRLTISCYFPDGFDVSTDYPDGISGESDKIIRRVVKSSVQNAFEFHKHHTKKHMAQHGKPKQFTSVQELLDWEDQHQLNEDSFKTVNKVSRKLWLRAIMAMFIAPVIGIVIFVPIYIFFIFQGYQEFPPILNTVSSIVSMGLIFLGMLWAFNPLYMPETVEDRKQKELA